MAITKVTNSLVAVNAIQGTLIADNAITSVHIAQNQVTAVQIPDGSITSTQIAANSIDTAELVTGSIDTIHIGDSQVTTAKIADLNVTTGKIANNAITSAKIPDGSITATQLDSSTAPTFGNITTTGSLRGPASFTIDPAAVGDNTGTVVIAGSLQVDGTTTTVNSTTLSVADKNIVIASGAADAAAANDAGLTVTGASATLLYKSSGDKWEFNKSVNFAGNIIGNDIKAAGSGGLSLQTDEGTKRIFIADSGDVKVGQLAVGSATTAPLHVAKASTDCQAIFGDNNSSIDDPSIRIIGRDSGNSAIRYTYVGLDADTNYGYIGYNAGAGGFVNALSFDTSGKVGIGATTLESPLHLDSLPDGNIITFGQSGRRHHLRTYFSSNANDSVLGFKLSNGNTNGGTVERLTIMGNGNLGINHTSPKASLHIDQAGNSWEDSILIEHSGADTGWNIHAETQDNSLWFGYNADTTAALTSQTASEYLVIDSSGGVGIGNNRPTINAHAAANNLVIGNTSTGDNGMTILGNANNTGRIFFGDPDLNREGQIEYVHNGDYFQFYASNALSFIAEEGQIGIGINPSETLHMYKASGSNEIRNQLGNNNFYMRHGVNRNSAQGTNVFDFHALNNQDVIVGTGNDFILSSGAAVNSDDEVRMRVNTNGTTVGPVSATATSLTNGLARRLWVKGGGVFHSNSQSGNTTPKGNNVALLLGPGGTRSTATNAGTVDYDSATSFGSLHGGIAWDHLLNYQSYGNVGYHVNPHGWLGMEMYDTPGHERSNMVMCTRPGTGSTDTTQAAMRWMATGEITTPRNPAFAAYGSSFANQTTEGNHGTWNQTLDRGGNFTAGSGAYFTAPVDGLYAFWAHCNFNTGSSTPYYWRGFKNSSGVGIFYGSGANQSWDHVMAYVMVAMDKNDTFEWRYKGDPDEGAEWAQCGGYLVG